MLLIVVLDRQAPPGERSVEGRCGDEDVFDFIGDQRNGPRWQAGLTEVRRLTDVPPGLGTRDTIVGTFSGTQDGGGQRVHAFEPGKLITFRTSSGPMPLATSFLVEPAAGGTRLTSRIEMHAAGFVSLAEPLIARSLRPEMDAALTKPKGLLEAPESTAATSMPAAR